MIKIFPLWFHTVAGKKVFLTTFSSRTNGVSTNTISLLWELALVELEVDFLLEIDACTCFFDFCFLICFLENKVFVKGIYEYIMVYFLHF